MHALPQSGPNAAVLESALTCRVCGHVKTEVMPADACQWLDECEACHSVQKPNPGDCCVFGSCGTAGGCCGAA